MPTAAPLKVGIIAPCPPPFGGIARVIENHLQFWDPSEVEAHFIPNYPPPNPQPFEGATFHDLAASDSRSLSGLGEYARCYARQPLTRPWVYAHFWRYNTALSALVKRENLDVIYAHEVWPAGACAVLQSRIHSIGSVVVTYGETWKTTVQYQRQHRIEPYVLGGSTRLVSTSDHCRNGAIRAGADPEKASVIYAGIDLERFHPGLDGSGFRASYGIPAEAFVISSLGLSLRRKLDTLLDALEILEVPGHVHCLIGGAGEDADYVEERARGIRNVKLHRLGFVSEAELPAFYAATDVLVVSPRTLIECMGQSMKEAMACGRGVVGARIGGVPEAIEHGENGLLYDAESHEELAEALQYLCNRPELCERFGAAGRRFAEDKFGARVAAAQTLEVLARAASEARGTNSR
jgi:phosphatidyl-myo-inositol dimannoside synthase